MCGANTSIPDLQGDTPLIHAARHASINILSMLIKAGASVSIQNQVNSYFLNSVLHNNKSNWHISVTDVIYNNVANDEYLLFFFRKVTQLFMLLQLGVSLKLWKSSWKMVPYFTYQIILDSYLFTLLYTGGTRTSLCTYLIVELTTTFTIL